MAQPGRILAIKPSSLGDILHLFPALALLRRAFPEAELDFLIRPEFAPLLDFSPFPVRRRILFERGKLGNFRTMLPAFFRLQRELRRDRYDLVIDFQGLLRSAFFSRLARSSSGVVGFARPREKTAALFYTKKLDVPRLHAVERNVALANFAAGTDFPVPETALPESSAGIAECADLPENFVALIPGARWPSKAFPTALFAGIAAEIHAACPEVAFVGLGDKGEIPVVEAIAAQLPPGIKLHNFAGRTSLPGMVEILRRARAVLSNDSGPLHAAALLCKGVFAFFGPTDPELTGPWGKNASVWRKNVPCLGCMRRECPQNLECHALSAGEIGAAVVQHLTQTQRIVSK